ncbi:D-alanyl-D-alanine carboxypeptidase/D-alanyl-D-alanine-endopeptidase [Sandaracinus amylolyticus]|uniref:D-alanyl-D-alanine carboxypeptidase/D-alanyl-D-alanine endopeptidase n=1 Tax=Sandaracinus amylolyticus TaxID=927083 RepID=UPI001F01E49A|nr:D-alanyl-D-alanine carboxypeptidase/D-alanyl-D-alanine-endopeptidase [Sandaracinus amylolyticus]UJR80956.1 D-alanyl-D-alanine carboxypeptidase/D-alanyl-D-alanine-endopeptidase [Sandaracinus amylolyticus]
MRRAIPLAAVLLCVSLLVRHDVRAQEAPIVSPLATSLSQLVSEAGFGETVSVTVLDAATGQTLFSHQSELALNPASNMKLVTAAAALARLGPEFRMRTALYGRVEGDGVATLSLRGFGDPSLTQADLVELARDLADHGVRRVGEVVVDATYFEGHLLPPAFDQQPGEVAPFRAATGAVSVDANAYTLRVLPGATVGAPARVRLDGAGYFALESTITTSESGQPSIVAIQRDQGEHMQLALRGTMPVGVTGVSYRRRIENPLAWAGHLTRDALAAAGIRSNDAVRIAATPDDAALLAQHTSEPLAEILSAMGKQSDNFVAEMVFRVLGAERHRPGRVEDSVAAVRDVLREAGVEPDRVQIVNGSGLFDGNRIASGDLARLLSWTYRQPGLRAEYVSHLAIGGVDGTLAGRLRDLPRPRIVRAKTGTLNDAIALSGYVLGPDPDRAVAFSVIVNGARGRHGPARGLCDGVARAIAQQLWAGR